MTSFCPECETLIPEHSPRGLCPRCCLRGLLPDFGGATAGGIPGIELLGRLGGGSFGEVHEGMELHAACRRVAVKILRESATAAGGRFLEEMRVLALLEHPHIARFFGAGHTEDGRPYYVMELIEGRRLDEWARAATPVQCFTVLRQTAEAVAHAHRQGIVHRDLKPANILVTESSGGPQAKVIDFGIARAVEGPASWGRAMTLAEQRIGTPLYMSPEQLAGDPRVDTRTDVWALGLLLGEVLLGHPLMEGVVSPQRSWAENLEAVRAAVLPPLSCAEAGWMVRKACACEPSQRYESAAEFAADLRALEEGRAVSVGAPYWRYRLRKFVRAHRGAFAAGAVLGILLLSLTAAGWWVSVRERHAREGIAAAMKLEQAARQRAEQAETALRRKSSDAALLAGSQAMDRGDFAAARGHLEESLRLWPDNAAAAYTRSFVLSTTPLPARMARLTLPWPAEEAIAVDGAFLVRGPEGQCVRITVGGQMEHGAAFPAERPPAMREARGGKVRVATDGSGVLTFTDATSGTPVMSPLVFGSGPERAVFCQDPERVLVLRGGTAAELWDVSAMGRAMETWQSEEPVTWLGFERESSDLWLIDAARRMRQWKAGGGPGWTMKAGQFGAGLTQWQVGEGHTRGLPPGDDNFKAMLQLSTWHLLGGGHTITSIVQAREADETLVSSSDGRLAFQRPGGFLKSITGHRGVPRFIAIPANAGRAAMINDAGEVQLLDPAKLQPGAHFKPAHPPMSLTFPDKSGALVIACADGSAEVRDSVSGQLLCGPFPVTGGSPPAGGIHVRAVPGAAEFFVCADGDVLLRRYSLTGEPAGPPLRHTQGIHWFCPSGDGQFLFSIDQRSDSPGHLRVWSLRTGRELVPALKHPARILWASILDNGRRIATSDAAGTVRRWVLEKGRP